MVYSKDMSITNTQAIFGLNAAGTSTRPLIAGTVNIGQAQQVVNLFGDIAFSGRAVVAEADECDVLFADFSLVPSTPTETSATAILESTGDNNDILLTADTAGAGGNDLSASIVIDDDSDRTQLTAAKSGDAITITSGDKRVMRVTADFGDGAETIEFTWLFDSWSAGFPYGSLERIDGDWSISGQETFIATVDGDFPDEATWPEGVTVVAAPATASQAITAINAASIDVTAANATGNDGTGAITAVASVDFAGGGEIENGWIGADLDFQGEAFENPDKIIGAYLHCVSGECHLEIDGAEIDLSAGERVQFANPSGIFSTLDAIQLTGVAPQSQIDVVILASS
jgi:hypothetical protein